MKKGIVFFVLFLFISMPFCIAEEINIPETFKAEGEPAVTSYFYLANNLIASKDLNGIKYYSQDRLGNNRLTTDFSANKIGETKTLPFGEEIINDNKFSFTGKELDSELYYFGARYYDFDSGRFTSVDPIGTDYQYVNNDPLNLVDLLGLAPGDPIENMPGYVENLHGAAISQERYDSWNQMREEYYSHKFLTKAKAFVDDISVENAWDDLLREKYPDMYFNPNTPTFADAWNNMGSVERAVLIANGAIFLVTMFAPVVTGAKTRAKISNMEDTPLPPNGPLYKINTEISSKDRSNGFSHYSSGPGNSQLVIESGKINDLEGKLYSGRVIWVVDENGHLILATPNNEKLNHGIVASGRAVQGAGTLRAGRGQVVKGSYGVTTETGHYFDRENPRQFAINSLTAFYTAAEDMGLNFASGSNTDVHRILFSQKSR